MIKHKKLIIGVTGGFGSGKTSVARMIKHYTNGCIVDADRLATKIMNKRKREIKREFGTNNRKKIADIVFDDKKKLQKLNKIVHPAVIRETKKIIKKKRGIIVLDVPLLFESKMDKLCDIVIVVRCKRNAQIRRSKFSRKEVLRRLKRQIPMKKKLKYADYIVDNNKTKWKTEKRVKKIVRSLKLL